MVRNMKRSDPAFQSTLSEAVDCLMREFIAWNEIQLELHASGHTSNYYTEGEMTYKRRVYTAIAERFVLEDVDFREWEWFETPWVGTDGNTGNVAYVVDFVKRGTDEPEMGILGFYVTRNHRFWYALPLAEQLDGNAGVYEVNAIETALNILECLAPEERETTLAE